MKDAQGKSLGNVEMKEEADGVLISRSIISILRTISIIAVKSFTLII